MTIDRVVFNEERIILTRDGKPIAALISLEDFDRLEKLEDEADAQATADARSDVERYGTVAWDDVKAQLHRG